MNVHDFFEDPDVRRQIVDGASMWDGGPTWGVRLSDGQELR